MAGTLKDLHPSPPVLPEVEFKTVCMVAQTISDSIIDQLEKAFDQVIKVEPIEHVESIEHLELAGEFYNTSPGTPYQERTPQYIFIPWLRPSISYCCQLHLRISPSKQLPSQTDLI